ncbi:MAG: hypothetical protein KGL39_17725 [Patescibacteria group bacterium]|nr:hypothetical protein [Patescibacteria group bacterium]
MNLLATLPDPSTQQAIGWLVVIIAAGATGMNAVLKLIDRFKDKPAPADVRTEAMERFALKSEFTLAMQRNEQEHRDLFARIGGVERGALSRMDALSKEWRSWVEEKVTVMVASNESGRENLHRRINDVLVAVSRIEGEMKRLAK